MSLTRLTLLLIVTCLPCAFTTPNATTLFESWMHVHNYSYPHSEYALRFRTFQATLDRLAARNLSNLPNSLAAMTPAEFNARNTLMTPNVTLMASFPRAPAVVGDAPQSFDWRDDYRGVLTPVKDQGSCGSCWAFASVECVESASVLAGNQLLMLSPQELVSCDSLDSGCAGGQVANAASFLQENGLESEADYPYTSGGDGSAGDCQGTSNPAVSVTGYNTLDNYDEASWPAMIAEYGPVAVAVYVDETSDDWRDYAPGGWTDKILSACDTPSGQINHAVVLVGYGTSESNTDYWVVRNSWGDTWGEDGYLYIPRGVGCMGITTINPGYFTVAGSSPSPSPTPTPPSPMPTPPSPTYSCNRHSSCGDCVADFSCGYCASLQSCIPIDNHAAVCSYDWLEYECPSCPSHDDDYSLLVVILVGAGALFLGLFFGAIVARRKRSVQLRAPPVMATVASASVNPRQRAGQERYEPLISSDLPPPPPPPPLSC